MRILTVTHFYEAHGGGIERVAGHLCRAFARLGATPVWAASDEGALPDSMMETAPLRCSNPLEKLTGLPMPLPGFSALRKLSQEVRRCDTVVIHDALYLTSVSAMLIAKAHRRRVIIIQHIAGIPFSSALLRLFVRTANFLVTRPMLRAADERVFISDTVRRDLLGSHASRSGELLFNGVDRSIFYPKVGRPSEDQSPAVPSQTGQRILFVGRYVEKKGLCVLRELAELRPEISFTLAGDGPIRPSDWQLANVDDIGSQHPRDLADLYRSADLLFLPSVGEGFPLVIQEAMACGLPVVCGAPSNRADPGADRWLRGVWIDLANPKASARRCAAVIDNFQLSSIDRADMADYAHRRYDWQSMALRLITIAQTPVPTGARVKHG